MKKGEIQILNFTFFVRLIGLEPTRLTTLDPKSSAATNYATSAVRCFSYFDAAKVRQVFELCKFFILFLLISYS